jgi:hypothetical protein
MDTTCPRIEGRHYDRGVVDRVMEIAREARGIFPTGEPIGGLRHTSTHIAQRETAINRDRTLHLAGRGAP